MDEIAEAAEFTRRTVYQHFISKQNLFYAVIVNTVRRLVSHIDDAVLQEEQVLNDTGHQGCAAQFVAESPDIYRLMNTPSYQIGL